MPIFGHTYFGHTYFGHNSAIFGPIGLTIFMGTHETIIDRLVMRNLSYDAYFHTPLIVWGLPTKKLTHLLDQKSGPLVGPLSRNHAFEIFRPEPPYLHNSQKRS